MENSDVIPLEIDFPLFQFVCDIDVQFVLFIIFLNLLSACRNYMLFNIAPVISEYNYMQRMAGCFCDKGMAR